MSVRIGQGFDTHRFGDGDHLMLGGVRIAHERGVIAHSDGDVVLHALADALLGAAALGDIGGLFPDTDPHWAGADSRGLLADVMRRVRERGWRVVNADCTVLAERPKVAPHVPAMRAAIASVLGVDESAVNVKGTTMEKMGFLGRGEGIAALAVVLLASNNESRS
ncbi:MAG: 2-C-methyl-D-erythritol 2,4-cyclodiphosphate synthase [Gammaproteobacteria bacterium]